MKRFWDVLMVLLALIIAAPIAVIVAALILTLMGRPILYRQARVGLNGALFNVVKFRTMVNDAVSVGHNLKLDDPLSVLVNDPRVPRLGRILRASSLDEIPQLWNILRGEMSVIGPRPTTPDQVEHYTRHQRGRLAVRPGLTGWAQVNGRNSMSWPQRIELDLWYIERRSLILDLKILVLTVVSLVRPSGVTGDGGNPAFPVPETAESSHEPLVAEGLVAEGGASFPQELSSPGGSTQRMEPIR